MHNARSSFTIVVFIERLQEVEIRTFYIDLFICFSSFSQS